MPRHTAASINRIAWFASLKGAADLFAVPASRDTSPHSLDAAALVSVSGETPGPNTTQLDRIPMAPLPQLQNPSLNPLKRNQRGQLSRQDSEILKGALDVDRAIWAHVDTQGCRKSSYESCLAPLAARVTTP